MPALPHFFDVGFAFETTTDGVGGDDSKSGGNTESLSSQDAAGAGLGAGLGTGLGAGRNGSGGSSGGGSSGGGSSRGRLGRRLGLV